MSNRAEKIKIEFEQWLTERCKDYKSYTRDELRIAFIAYSDQHCKHNNIPALLPEEIYQFYPLD